MGVGKKKMGEKIFKYGVKRTCREYTENFGKNFSDSTVCPKNALKTGRGVVGG